MEDAIMKKNLSLSIIPLLAFGTLITPLQAIAQTQQQPTAPPQNYYWPGPWHMMSFWGMFPMMLLFLVFFCVIAFFFVRVCMGGMHRWGPSPPWGNPTHSALQILNERLAKGEIQKDEYNERKAALLSGARS
jgi:uncharacterized membrane protein